MGIASSSFTICIRNENPLVLAEDLLRLLSNGFLQPKSLEIHLPGRKFEKAAGSIDGNVFWGKDDLPLQLPGEKIIIGNDLTILENPEDWLTIPRDLPCIMECLHEYSEESSRLWQSRQAMDDDVYWAFWGLCHLAQKSNTSSPKEGYFLRQQLRQAQRLEPILRVTSHLIRHPRLEFIVRLFTRSFVWSRYTSEFDTTTREWITKRHLQSEQENARLLAEAFSSFVRKYPNAEVEWEHEQQHSPDLTGFVALEFQARLGTPKTPQRVRNLEAPR
jgi:hypothetical protein